MINFPLWLTCLPLSSPKDVEECQLSECGAEEELGAGDSTLQRSSSTSDITQQLSDSFPGTAKINKTLFGRFETYSCGVLFFLI